MKRAEKDKPARPATSSDTGTLPFSLLIVRPNFAQGGADRITVTLLESLDRSVVKPSLALFRREGPYLDRIPDDVPLEILGARSLWTAWWPLARLLRAARPDIVFSTCSGTNVVACLAALISRRRHRLVLSERNMLMRDQPVLKKWLMYFAKRLLYPIADCVTAVSAGVAADVEVRLDIPRNSIRVVFNPVVGPELGRLAEERLDDPPFDLGQPVILAAGRLVPAKGFDILIDAFAAVADGTSANLVILGDGPLRHRLRQRAERTGFSDRVFLPGFVGNPFKYMARAALFVLSSRFEGLPGVLIQAMACGTPVVATDCAAGPREIIGDSQSGILIPVDATERMSQEILRLLEDSYLRRRLGEAARERAQDFTIDAITNAYCAALTGIDPPPADSSIADFHVRSVSS